MLGKYLTAEYDLANSYVIGDRPTDVELARNLGAKAIYIKNDNFRLPPEAAQTAYTVETWKEIFELLRRPDRTAAHRRKTNETDIVIELNLDGSGKAEISTGISFFDHMLEQVARHGSVDLKICADANIGRGRQVHDVVAGEHIGPKSAQPPRELLHIDHLQPPFPDC